MIHRVKKLVRDEVAPRAERIPILRKSAFVYRGFFKRDGLMVGSALSFESILGLVPLLALVVAVLKGMGSYGYLRERVIDPWLARTFSPGNPVDFQGTADDGHHLSTLGDAFSTILELVDTAEVGSLGAVGLIALLYIVWNLLRSIEHALNQIFGAPRARRFGRTLVDYAAILFVVPMGAFLLSGSVSWSIRLQQAGIPAGALVHITSVLITTLGALLLYLVMPNRRPPFLAAISGAFVSGAVTYVAFLLQVYAQLGVARYNALYSGFAAVPLFLLWIFVSWIGVVVGAELAAVLMDEEGYRERLESGHASVMLLESTALRAVILIARSQRARQHPPAESWLADRCGVSIRTLREALEPLEAENIVFKGGEETVAFALVGDPSRLQLADVLEAVRSSGTVRWSAEEESDPAARHLLTSLNDELEHEPFAFSLRELLDRFPETDDEASEEPDESRDSAEPESSPDGQDAP